MKRISILLAILLVANIPFCSAAKPSAFFDIRGHWAEEIIMKYYSEGTISGYPDGAFRPDDPVKRGELAKIITNAFDLKEEIPFDYPDIDGTEWFYDYLKYSANYIPSYQYLEYSFFGNNNAHRIDVAETLIEIRMQNEDLTIEMPSPDNIVAEVLSIFEDIDYSAGKIEYPNVQRLFKYTWLSNEMNIIEGYPDGNFHPYWGITRAELLTVIDRIKNY